MALLWRRPASVAPVRPLALAWELTYGTGTTLKNKNKRKETMAEIMEKDRNLQIPELSEPEMEQI